MKIKIAIVGDIMLDRGIKFMIDKHQDFKFPFLKIADYLKNFDFVFGNLEGPISDKGYQVGSIYSFRANPKVIEGLKFSNFNILSLANNHSLDFTSQALEDTFLWLKQAQIDYVGAGFNENETYSPLIKEIKGTKIGFLAYTNLGPHGWKAGPQNSGMAWVSEDNLEKIKEDIKIAKQNTDVLFVSLHAGNEYQKEPIPFQILFAKTAIESGADFFIGHHPHLVQENEKYLNNYIFYSLGNFIFDQSFSQETTKGQLIEIKIADKKIQEVLPLEIKINNFFQPEITN